MGDSVVDALFAAHYARLGGDALQDEDFDSDDDLDEVVDACVAEECAAAYVAHAFELKVGEAAATGGKFNPATWLRLASQVRPVIAAIKDAIKAEADESGAGMAKLKIAWKRAGGDAKARAKYAKFAKFIEENGLDNGKGVMSYDTFKEEVRSWLDDTKGKSAMEKLKELVKRAIKSAS